MCTYVSPRECAPSGISIGAAVFLGLAGVRTTRTDRGRDTGNGTCDTQVEVYRISAMRAMRPKKRTLDESLRSTAISVFRMSVCLRASPFAYLRNHRATATANIDVKTLLDFVLVTFFLLFRTFCFLKKRQHKCTSK